MEEGGAGSTVNNRTSHESPNRSGYYNFRKNGFITGVSYKARKKTYDLFLRLFPDVKRIADYGVTAEGSSAEANLLEQLYPDKGKITAISIEDAGFLEKKYPGMKFVKVLPDQRLPFDDDYFDVVYSHAVIEHITGDRERSHFIEEITRIGRCVFLTTPNRYFPLETHTLVPFLHFLMPSFFYFLLDRKVLSRFYNSGNLRLLGKKELEALAGGLDCRYSVFSVRTCGLVSNFALVIYKRGAV